MHAYIIYTFFFFRLSSFFFLKPFNISHELVCLFVFAAAACGCRDPVRAPLKHEWATWLFWQKNLFCFAERVNKNGIKLHYSMKICSILTFSLKCNTWQLWLRLEFVLYNRVNSKTKSVLFSVIDTQNVQKHTKNLNISFVVTCNIGRAKLWTFRIVSKFCVFWSKKQVCPRKPDQHG